MQELQICAFIVAGVALVTDLDQGRIPNGLTLPALVIGILAQTWFGGWTGLGLALGGAAIGVGLLIVPFASGMMGGGDVKLVAALGALLGPLEALIIILVAGVVAGILGALVVARQGMFGRAWQGAMGLVRLGRPEAPLGSVGSLPYAVPVAIGTILARPLLWSLLG